MENVYILRQTDGREYSVSRETRIGREPPCEILIRDPQLAPHHATLWVQDNFLFVRDHASASGVFVNEARVPAGQAFQLRPGDNLRLGAVAFSIAAAAPAVPDDTLLGLSPPVPAPAEFALRLPDGQTFAVRREARLGRSPDCDLPLPDDGISAHHATVWVREGVLLVRDEGATNGTFLNEARLPPGQPTPLRPRDELRLGRIVLTVAAGVPGAAASRPVERTGAPATEMIRETMRLEPPPPPPAAPPTAWLLHGPDGRVYHITRETVVGREADCDIVLGDLRASRRHAVLWVEYGALMVRDENSSNGTLVRGQRIAPGQAAALRAGDHLRFADTVFAVEQAGGPGTAVRPRTAAPATLGLSAAAPPMPQYATPTAQQPAPAAYPPAPAAPPAKRAVSPLLYVLIGGGAIVLLGLLGLAAFLLLGPRPAVPVPGGTPSSNAPPSLTPQALATAPATGTPGAVSVVTNYETPPLLKPDEFAAASQTLPEAVAALNQAQLAFIQAASADSPDGAALDAALVEVAALAMTVAQQAQDLGDAMLPQDGASEAAGQTADHYYNVAQSAYALVIEAQNLRDGLRDGTVQPAAAAALVADYGARLWNPAGTFAASGAASPQEHENPFLPYLADPASVPVAEYMSAEQAGALQAQLGEDVQAQSWLTMSSESVERTITVPSPAGLLANPADPAVLEFLTTAAGQADGDLARQAAVQQLEFMGSGPPNADGEFRLPTDALDLTLLLHSTVAVARHPEDLFDCLSNPDCVELAGAANTRQQPADEAPAQDPAAQPVGPPAFPGGTAVSTGGSGLDDSSNLFGLTGDIMTDLINFSGESGPAVTAQTPVEDTGPIMDLTITGYTVNSIGESDPNDKHVMRGAQVSVDVAWNTNLPVSAVELECRGAKNVSITEQQGRLTITAVVDYTPQLGAYPFSCIAKSPIAPCRVYSRVGATVVFDEEVAAAVDATETAYQATIDTEHTVQAATFNARQTIRAATEQAREEQTHIAETEMGTQFAQETEFAATFSAERTAEFAATITQIAKLTQDAQAAGAFTLNGTFGLSQSDSGCRFSTAPFTSGTLVINVDFGTGAASGSLEGGGGGTRAGLRCNNDTGDMQWTSSYSATFSGTVDPATGALNMNGTLSGTGSSSWSNCKSGAQSISCPSGSGDSYSFPVVVNGTVNAASQTGNGTLTVTNISLPTSGDWSGG